MSICLIDTSILCEILQVPTKRGNHAVVYAEMQMKIETESLLLPMSSILETGNHIGQNGDGRQRRATADRFVKTIRQALQGETPFTTTPLVTQKELDVWLAEFPDWTLQRSGLADLTIFKEFQRQCDLNPGQRVYIWSTDQHLAAYDRTP